MDDPVIPQNSFTPVPQALSQEPTSPVQQVPPNIQTDSVSASVLPPLPDQNNASSTPEKSQILIATESSKPKRSLAKRYVIFVIICLLLVGIGLGLSRMYISMKTSFNPVLSPIVENYLYTPGQQFSARMQTLTTVTAIGLASELKDLGMNVDTDYTDLELSTYKNTVGKLITGFELTSDSKVNATSKKPLTNILGITSEAGKIDTAFLTEWMSATNVTVSVNGTQSFDIHNRIAPKIKGTLNLRVALPNSQVSSSLDFLLHENKNLVMLKTFPENDYVDMTPIINKWIQFDSTDFSTLVAEAKKDSVKDTLEIKREYVNKLIRVATVPEFINRIKKAPPVIVNGITMKCFSIDLDATASKEIAAAMQAKAVELKLTSSPETFLPPSASVVTTSAATSTTLCFAANQFFPTKISSTSSYKDINSDINYETVFTIQPLATDATFNLPSSDTTIRYQDLPYEQMLKPQSLQFTQGID